MSDEEHDRYLKYIVSRLSAFRNIWWSMANEYDLLSSEVYFIKRITNKNIDDWERLATVVFIEVQIHPISMTKFVAKVKKVKAEETF